MLDLIALIILVRYIGKLAEKKGEKPRTWKIRLILSWFLFEFAGAIIGLMLFNYETNMFSIVMVMAMFAATAFFITKNKLDRLPDKGSLDEEIDQLGY